MSQRLVDVDTTKGGSASTQITEEEQNKGAVVEVRNEAGEVVETREAKKARRAEILARGMAADRLHVDYPTDKYYGEWVPFKDGGVQVHRKKSLGFWIDKEFAPMRALHSGESLEGGSVIGDTVFMLCSREDKEILDELRQERFNAIHKPKRGKQKEEQEFESKADAETAPNAGSSIRKAGLRNIVDAIESAGKQQ